MARGHRSVLRWLLLRFKNVFPDENRLRLSPLFDETVCCESFTDNYAAVVRSYRNDICFYRRRSVIGSTVSTTRTTAIRFVAGYSATRERYRANARVVCTVRILAGRPRRKGFAGPNVRVASDVLTKCKRTLCRRASPRTSPELVFSYDSPAAGRRSAPRRENRPAA